jgi:hypothetical protein
MKLIRWILVVALFVPLFIAAQSAPQADAKRFAGIKAKHDSGQPITPEEREFATRYMAQHKQSPNQDKNRKNSAEQYKEYAAAHPPRESTGLVPLTDLGTGTYKGNQGGLYPGGENTPPPASLKAGITLSKEIVPLDGEGRKSAEGKIVLLSIGMSNTTMEFQTFQKLAAADKSLNPRLKIVDGAQGAQTALRTAQPEANFWTVVEQRLQAAGVTARQVEAVWMKQANGKPTEGFPTEAKKLQADVVSTLHNLHDKFPNLKIAYLSSRIYGGYAVSPLNPEPYAYEGAFAMKWAIADQIAGSPELNYDPTKGQVRSPWITWGPYLWADGVKGRKQDGLVWLKDDVIETDRTHPSQSGREKVAKLLLDFFKKDPTSRLWFAGK